MRTVSVSVWRRRPRRRPPQYHAYGCAAPAAQKRGWTSSAAPAASSKDPYSSTSAAMSSRTRQQRQSCGTDCVLAHLHHALHVLWRHLGHHILRGLHHLRVHYLRADLLERVGRGDVTPCVPSVSRELRSGRTTANCEQKASARQRLLAVRPASTKRPPST